MIEYNFLEHIKRYSYKCDIFFYTTHIVVRNTSMRARTCTRTHKINVLKF